MKEPYIKPEIHSDTVLIDALRGQSECCNQMMVNDPIEDPNGFHAFPNPEAPCDCTCIEWVALS